MSAPMHNTRPIPCPAAGSRGFTLVELMIAMVVSSIVVLGIFAFSTIQQHTSDIHERHVRVQRALEGAMWSISQDMQGAGMGWTRYCTELRVWDDENDVIINPGAITDPTSPLDTQLDDRTGEPYWVLRDGIQVFWHSAPGDSLAGSTNDSSADQDSAADAFDVFISEANYVESIGVFGTTMTDIDTAGGTVTVTTNSTTLPAGELEEVQQMFPPGSFIIVGRDARGRLPVHPTRQGQCVLLQVTSDVTSAGAGRWTIPTGTLSGFNEDLSSLFADDGFDNPDCWSGCGAPDDDGSGNDGCGTSELDRVRCDDWRGDSSDFDFVVPLGRVRWSRYEIDYTIPAQPYLVRYDLIDAQSDDNTITPSETYPSCDATCPMPQLHLFESDSDGPEAVAIGPMVEDLQVAAGCDGYNTVNAGNAIFQIPNPDNGFDEMVQYAEPDGVIDEQTAASGSRDTDEWVGNAQSEVWAPDCVYWGTAEYRKDDWETWYLDTTNFPPGAAPSFRLHPQRVRVTLTASSEFAEESGSLAQLQLPPIEDRAAIDSPVGVRTRFSLTESFTPPNLRWRDPSIF
jgi:prepilin-type N-terminal cleavage/methylation domain-containing protein